ncbi:MAG: ABC transporter ATP-binding protein [Candidatus Adiutrix sp.]|jgi:ABC-2 type transport system ATP-binding protein|nr:ABC transporter ATP-binding protein [Candidatus Adiutrix sp.]
MVEACFKNVTKRYGSRVVFAGASFELAAGARCGLIGPNGAGKSTLLRLLMGSLRPDAGEVTVGGLPPWRHPARVRAEAGFLPEDAPLLGDLTGREHLALAARLRGLTPGEFAAEEDRLTAALGLGGFYLRPAGVLSQGQRRRMALASALLGSPGFLALDEPGGGLDPEESFRLLALLKDLPQSTTLLISSHFLNEIRDLAGQVLALAGGRLNLGGPLTGGDAAALRRDYLKRLGGETGR